MGLQRLAGAKHRAKSSLARALLSLTIFYFCSTAWVWALDPGRRISQSDLLRAWDFEVKGDL